MKILKLALGLLLTLTLFGCQAGNGKLTQKFEENQNQAQENAQNFSGNYQLTYDLNQIEIAVGGATYVMKLDEIKGGAAAGEVDIPPEIADALLEKLPQNVNFTIADEVKAGAQKITYQDLDNSSNPSLNGLFTLRTNKAVFGKLSDLKQEGSCGSLGGVLTGVNFYETSVSGNTTIGFMAGCKAVLVTAKATVKWTASLQ